MMHPIENKWLDLFYPQKNRTPAPNCNGFGAIGLMGKLVVLGDLANQELGL
jgi:hypothetical protein